MFLNSGARTLARHSVNVVVHAPPQLQTTPSSKTWTESEMLDHAEKIILKDLKAVLQQDIVERVVMGEITRIMTEEKAKGRTTLGAAVEAKMAEEQSGRTDSVDRSGMSFSTSLKGLSFRKQKKPVEEVKPPPVVEEVVVQPTPVKGPILVQDELELQERPRKKPRKVVPKVVEDEDIESEDDKPAPVVTAPVVTITITEESTSPRKRASSVSTPIEEPPKKKTKKETKAKDAVAPQKKVRKSRKAEKAEQPVIVLKELIHEVDLNQGEYSAPAVAQVHVTPVYEPSPPPASPVVQPKKLSRRSPPTPPKAINPFEVGVCDDDEDVYFAKLALDQMLHGREPPSTVPEEPEHPTDGPSPFRVHATGSARSEGYYKISHAEKSAYVAQYATRGTANETAAEEEQPPQQPTITSSRSNRANARRRAQGLEEINQVQLAMALSKGENAATELVKFNQLQTRKKHLRFARSPIHDWGLYAMEKISRGEMVIEYVGEIIRAQVADKREKAYERQGIGSSYLFRIDEDLVVDATKKGNLGYVFDMFSSLVYQLIIRVQTSH